MSKSELHHDQVASVEAAILEYSGDIKPLAKDDLSPVLRALVENHRRRGDCLSFLGRYEEALLDYDRAIWLNFGSAALYHSRANVRFNLQRYYDAGRDYSRAAGLGHSLAYAGWRQVRNILGDHKKRDVASMDHIRLYPPGRYWLGVILADAGVAIED